MTKPVVIIGMGEMGGVFARAFLRSGYPVYPVVRGMALADAATQTPEPELVLVAVAEGELDGVLESMPDAWRDRLVLLQNELLPANWLRFGLEPSVISVWFEKKKGMDAKVIIPSPVYGRHAKPVVDALASIGIAARELASEQELLFELVLKNVYILTTNIAGLKTGGDVGELWAKHQSLARRVAADVIKLQEKLTGETLDADALISGMVHAFEGDFEHQCMGRSAPARLKRALTQAENFGLRLETLEEIANLAS
jgi:ketopantoate reductase